MAANRIRTASGAGGVDTMAVPEKDKWEESMIKAVVLLAAAAVFVAIVIAFIVYPIVEVWGQARGFRGPKR